MMKMMWWMTLVAVWSVIQARSCLHDATVLFFLLVVVEPRPQRKSWLAMGGEHERRLAAESPAMEVKATCGECYKA